MRCRSLLAVAIAASGFAQDHCTVTEDRFEETATGHFSVGPVTVDLTIPLHLYDEEWLAVVISAKGDTGGLSLQSVEEVIPLRNGAVLETVTRRGQLPGFSILNHFDERVCTWQPEVFPIQLRRPPPPYERVMASQKLLCRKIGEPMTFRTEGTTPSDTDVFRIDGVPMPVLAYTRDQMILRDPAPSVGLRKITAESYDVTLRFFETRIVLNGNSPKRKTAVITVRGLEKLNESALLRLEIRNPDSARLGCGRIPNYNSGSRLIMVSPAKIRDGAFHFTCPVSEIQAGQDPVIDVHVLELPGRQRPPPGRRLPWPEYKTFKSANALQTRAEWIMDSVSGIHQYNIRSDFSSRSLANLFERDLRCGFELNLSGDIRCFPHRLRSDCFE